MTPEEMRAKAEELKKTDAVGAQAWLSAAVQVEKIESLMPATDQILRLVRQLSGGFARKKGVR